MKTGKGELVKNHTVDLVYNLAGALLYVVGINCFVEPSNIAPGGVSGIAIMIRYLWGLPIGLVSFVLNIPLLLLAYRQLSPRFALKTLQTLVISTVLMDFVAAPFFPKYIGDRLLGSVFGGILMGAGLAVIFLRGSTTGGTDIMSYLIRKRFPHVAVGQGMMMIDCCILLVSMLVFENMEAGLFGMVSLFCTTKVIDGIIYGVDKGTMVTVISQESREIARRVLEELERGATLLSGKGAYEGKEKDVLLCVVRKQEFARLKAIVYETDPKAFVIVTEAGEILGEGFKQMDGK